MNNISPELQTALPDSQTYEDLAGQATSHDEIVALREMAQQDLGSTAATTASLDGQELPVTPLGSERFQELNKTPEEIEAGMSASSEGWSTEEK